MALRTIYKVNNNDFMGENITVLKVGYPEESDMLRLDMGGSTVYKLKF